MLANWYSYEQKLMSINILLEIYSGILLIWLLLVPLRRKSNPKSRDRHPQMHKIPLWEDPVAIPKLHRTNKIKVKKIISLRKALNKPSNNLSQIETSKPSFQKSKRCTLKASTTSNINRLSLNNLRSLSHSPNPSKTPPLAAPMKCAKIRKGTTHSRESSLRRRTQRGEEIRRQENRRRLREVRLSRRLKRGD